MDNTLLLVDDEEGIRKVLGILLADIGYNVIPAADGEEALRLFREHAPPIVLSDIKMPRMDGVTLLQRIKEENPETEVIMVTAHGDMDLAVKSLQYEATDFITKPINNDVLEISLKRAKERIFMREKLREYTENLEEMVKEKSARLVEAERLAAVGQAVEGLSSAMQGLAGNIEGGIHYFNEMPCFVAVHNPDLSVVTANHLYSERLGKGVGSRSWEIYSENNPPEACPAAKTFQTGEGRRFRETIYYADGHSLPALVYTAPIRNSAGELALVLEISADISEVKRLQEKLRTTQYRYQQLFEAVPCYVTVQDRNFKITEANQRFKEDFGEGVDSHCYNVYKHRNKPCGDCPVAKTFDDSESHQSEMVVSALSGKQYNVLITTAPLKNTSGETTHVIEMSADITQIRQLQDRLSSLGFLIGSISHGIKGLLTGLDAGMYLLDTGFERENKDKIQEGWELVKLMVDRIRSMVLDILYYAKERELKWESVDVFRFSKDLANTIEPKLTGQDIVFARNFDPSVGSFEVDPTVMRSAIINILENAVEACIADKSKVSHRIEFNVKNDEDHICFEVIDDGIGMDRETREKMFTLFFSSKGHLGTGLGLFISNKIVQQHGGDISVISEPGKGSQFTVRVPNILPEYIKSASQTSDMASAESDIGA